jgi:hypothetical protein
MMLAYCSLSFLRNNLYLRKVIPLCDSFSKLLTKEQETILYSRITFTSWKVFWIGHFQSEFLLLSSFMSYVAMEYTWVSLPHSSLRPPIIHFATEMSSQNIYLIMSFAYLEIFPTFFFSILFGLYISADPISTFQHVLLTIHYATIMTKCCVPATLCLCRCVYFLSFVL